MCAPMAILGVAGAAMSGIGGIMAVRERNTQAAVNRQNAALANNDQTQFQQYNYINKVKATNEAAFDAVLKGRAERGMIKANAASQGVKGHSVDAVLQEATGFAARDAMRAQDERYTHAMNYKTEQMSAQARMRNVWAQNQPESMTPALIGMATDVMSAGVSGFARQKGLST